MPDYDVDADHLANAASDGKALSPAPIAVRRRAVLENGLRPFFHGGWMSALCIDIRYDDSRSQDEQDWARQAAMSARDPDEPLEEGEAVDISFTMAEDGMEVSLWRCRGAPPTVCADSAWPPDDVPRPAADPRLERRPSPAQL